MEELFKVIGPVHPLGSLSPSRQAVPVMRQFARPFLQARV